MSNTTPDSSGKQCDCCLNNISDDSDHIQNNPCDHIVCTLCVVTSNMKWGANPAYCCQVKDCPRKYTISCQYFTRGNPGKVIYNEVAIIDKVCTDSDVLADVFAYLVPEQIMSVRRVCKQWEEAAKMTLTSIWVKTMDHFNAMRVMTTALPNLQGLMLFDIDVVGTYPLRYSYRPYKYSDGEDPNEEEAARTTNLISLDIEIISNFSKLRDLTLYDSGLNGRYPFLFNSFPLLEKLGINYCPNLKWDLEMLAGMPLLKVLECCNEATSSSCVTGNINSLNALKDTLEKVFIAYCGNIEGSTVSLRALKNTLQTLKIINCQNIRGNFMDLADFPHLKVLNLLRTAVTGDIRDIGEHDFSSLEDLNLPNGVYGRGYMRLLEATNHNRGIDCTDIDVCAPVFAYFMPKELMVLRRVCKEWEEAVMKTIVPLNSYFEVGSVADYNAMSVMTRALPNLQQLSIRYIEDTGHKWSEGEDPPVRAVRTADWTTHDVGIISNFSVLRYLSIYNPLLNGRYPVLFNSFPLLQILSIHDCKYLKWDLEMLAGMPLLKELECWDNPCLTGNISSLRVLKDTLEKVKIYDCQNVEGNLMDLADFPQLKELHLLDDQCLTGNISSLRSLKGTLERVSIRYCSNIEGDFMDLADFPHLKMLEFVGTAVTGDIRDIREDDFSSLEYPKGVYGGHGYQFRRISDASDVARAVYLLKKQRPALKMYWQGKLSEDSPDWYESMNIKYPPPFYIRFVQAGSRIGYRWEAGFCRSDESCEVNWLDPEPSGESSDYGKYTEELQKIEKGRQEEGRVDLYKGIHQPPTEEEYHRLLEEYDLLPREEEVM